MKSIHAAALPYGRFLLRALSWLQEERRQWRLLKIEEIEHVAGIPVSGRERAKVVTSLHEFQDRGVLICVLRDTSRFHERGDDQYWHTWAQAELIDLRRGNMVVQATEIVPCDEDDQTSTTPPRTFFKKF